MTVCFTVFLNDVTLEHVGEYVRFVSCDATNIAFPHAHARRSGGIRMSSQCSLAAQTTLIEPDHVL